MTGDKSGSTSKRAEAGSADSPFNRSVFSVLEHIEYRVCEKGEDLEAIYRLRYESYRSAGMVRQDAARMVTDAYDNLPNARRFGVFYDGNLVSTLRIHYINAENPVAPSCGVFGDIIEPHLKAGQMLIDPSRFAADAEWARTLRVLPYITLRIGVLALKHFDADYCMIAIKEEHSAFYHRVFNARPATGPRTYPGLEVPVHLLRMDVRANVDNCIERFPFFRYTPLELRMLFDRPKKGEVGPLTILPTAKFQKRAA